MDTKTFNVLLIEPDKAVAQTITGWLSSRCQITHVFDYDSIIKEIALTNWDLVITDIDLPELDDLDITQTIKSNVNSASVLIVTRDKKVDFLINAIHNHADGLLFKPLDQNEFTTKALQLAGESRLRKLKEQKIVLAIGAHPDDVEFGCGATLAKYKAEGALINILTLSLGEVGGDPLKRRNEAEISAREQGAQLFFGGLSDTEIDNSSKTITLIEKIVQQVKPTHIFTHSFFDSHQDHNNTYKATITACRLIPNLFSYLSPSSTVDFKPNIFINIDDFIDIKQKIIKIFASQSEIRPYLKPDMILAIARYWGRFCNYHLAEPLEVIKKQDT